MSDVECATATATFHAQRDNLLHTINEAKSSLVKLNEEVLLKRQEANYRLKKKMEEAERLQRQKQIEIERRINEVITITKSLENCTEAQNLTNNETILLATEKEEEELNGYISKLKHDIGQITNKQ